MSVEENKELITNYIRESNAIMGDISKYDALIEKYFTPDCIIHFAHGGDLNIEQFKGVATYMFNAFSDMSYTIDDLVAEGNKVVLRSTWEGTQKGEWLGVAPASKKATQTTTGFFRIAGGKIAESWMLTDTFGMMIQLGAIPNPFIQQ